MRHDNMHEDIRRTRIYQGLYRPSSNFSRFLSTLLSIILLGHSQVDNAGSHYFRKHR